MSSPSRNTVTLRAVLAAIGLACAALLVFATGAWADPFSPEDSSSPNAAQIDSLYWWITGMAIIVFLGVEGVLFYSLWKFRARRGRVAAQIHGNTQLEIGWTVGAAVILVFITAVTFAKLGDIKNPAASGPNGLDLTNVPVSNVQGDRDQPPPPGGKSLNINVIGQQYVWQFQYPALEEGADVFTYEEMVVPENTTVTMDLTSIDVQHSWWIPALGGKYDTLPSYVNKGWFKAPAVKNSNKAVGDVYNGQCAELCGRGHAAMYGRVRVLGVQEWQDWYRRKNEEIQQAREEGAQERERIARERGIPGGAEGTVGSTSDAPDLDSGAESEAGG